MKQLPERPSANYTNGIWFIHHDDDIIIRIWLSLMTGKEKVYANDELVIDMRNVTSMSTFHHFVYGQNHYEIEVHARNLMGGFECNFFRNGYMLASYINEMDAMGKMTIREEHEVTAALDRAYDRYMKEAKKHFQSFDLDDAELAFRKIMAVHPDDGEPLFYLACIASLREEKELGFELLQEALGKGLKGKERILSADQLAYLRIQPEFEGMLQHLLPPGSNDQ